MTVETETIGSENDAGEAERESGEAGALARFWCAEIQFALKEREAWVERSRRVERRYHDERAEKRGRKRRFNVLWSNVETMRPAIYMQTPKPMAGRRWRQRDPSGRLGSMLLERCLQVSCEEYDFDNVMEQAVRDRLLPGLGQAWVLYEPTFYAEAELGPDGAPVLDEKGQPVTYQAIETEQALADYVRWDDFLTSPARTWGEVRWTARRHYFGKKKGAARFGPAFKELTFDNKRRRGVREESDASEPPGREPRAVVWEVWDKDSGEVLFVAPSSGEKGLLEQRAAPIKFKGFFPCPRPLSATTTSESILPSPDYLQYQDQAEELNEITNRIDKLQRALKIAGLYDKSNTDLAKLLDASEGQMVAVDNWSMYAESGGVNGQVEWYPVEKVITVLRELYGAREQSKQILYEVSGIADVMRGATDPNETLGAQKLKARWGSGRVRRMQKDVQRFAAEIFELKAEIIAEVFQDQTILEMAGVDAELLAKYAPAGSDPRALVAQVMGLLRQDMRRTFHINVETDSTLEPDETAERAWRTQFLTGMAAMLKELTPLAQQGPEAAKLAGEMIMLGVRGFKEADQLEEIVEAAVEAAGKAAAMRQQAQAAAAKSGPPADPKLAEVQRKTNRDRAELAIEMQDRERTAQDAAAERAQAGREFEVDTALRVAEMRLGRLNGAAHAAQRDEMAEALV